MLKWSDWERALLNRRTRLSVLAGAFSLLVLGMLGRSYVEQPYPIRKGIVTGLLGILGTTFCCEIAFIAMHRIDKAGKNSASLLVRVGIGFSFGLFIVGVLAMTLYLLPQLARQLGFALPTDACAGICLVVGSSWTFVHTIVALIILIGVTCTHCFFGVRSTR